MAKNRIAEHTVNEWLQAIMHQQSCSLEEAKKQMQDAELCGMSLESWLKFNEQPAFN